MQVTTRTDAPPVMRATTLLSRITEAWLDGKRRVWLEGGTWASKTYSALQFLSLVARRNPDPLLISIVAETMPHLRRGAIRDFLAILGPDYLDTAWNRSDFVYQFPSGSTVEFFSADQASKLRGGRRDILFINEANNVSYDAFREMDMRTRLFTIADWNPTAEFWFHGSLCYKGADGEYHPLNDNEVLLRSTYEDAREVIPASVVADIASYEARDPNWWRVYGLGLLGKLEGLVHPVFEQVDVLPDGPRFYGLDFGFSSDPTVLVENVVVGENLYSREVLYDDTGLTNDALARQMELAKVDRRAPIYPDPSEPKSAQELRDLGWNVRETVKGHGSVAFGIQRVNQYVQHWTTDSLNCIKAQRNYRWVQDRDGNYTDKTTHRWSHGMDARRYACASFVPIFGGTEPEPVSYM